MPETNVLMTSVGSYLPARVLTNEELSGFVDTSDSGYASAQAFHSGISWLKGN